MADLTEQQSSAHDGGHASGEHAEGAGPVNMAAPPVHGDGDEFDDGGEDEGSTDRGGGRQAEAQDQERRGKAAASNAGEADSESDDKTEQRRHLVKVWMPHSSFCPAQRPERGSSGFSGFWVQGAQPMLG